MNAFESLPSGDKLPTVKVLHEASGKTYWVDPHTQNFFLHDAISDKPGNKTWIDDSALWNEIITKGKDLAQATFDLKRSQEADVAEAVDLELGSRLTDDQKFLLEEQKRAGLETGGEIN